MPADDASAAIGVASWVCRAAAVLPLVALVSSALALLAAASSVTAVTNTDMASAMLVASDCSVMPGAEADVPALCNDRPVRVVLTLRVVPFPSVNADRSTDEGGTPRALARANVKTPCNVAFTDSVLYSKLLLLPDGTRMRMTMTTQRRKVTWEERVALADGESNTLALATEDTAAVLLTIMVADALADATGAAELFVEVETVGLAAEVTAELAADVDAEEVALLPLPLAAADTEAVPARGELIVAEADTENDALGASDELELALVVLVAVVLALTVAVIELVLDAVAVAVLETEADIVAVFVVLGDAPKDSVPVGVAVIVLVTL